MIALFLYIIGTWILFYMAKIAIINQAAPWYIALLHFTIWIVMSALMLRFRGKWLGSIIRFIAGLKR